MRDLFSPFPSLFNERLNCKECKITKQMHQITISTCSILSAIHFTAQRRIRRTRDETNKLMVMDLKVDNQDGGHEYQFWEGKCKHVNVIWLYQLS